MNTARGVEHTDEKAEARESERNEEKHVRERRRLTGKEG